MRRREEQDAMKKKLTLKQQNIEYSLDTEIIILLPYIKIMPISMQSKFAFALKQVSERQPINEVNKQSIEKILGICPWGAVDTGKIFHLLQLFCRFLKLNKLRQSFMSVSKKGCSKQKNQQNNYSRDSNNFGFVPFQPNIQKQTMKFQPIQHIINPNYQNIIKLYKTFTDVHINMEYKIKQLNENYSFYAQPRFICKLQEMRDFQTSFNEKGNILMMSFEGNKIIGKRGFAFSNNNIIYWWEKNYKDIKDLVPDISEDKEKEQKEKGKRMSQREETKNQQVEKPKYTQNFKLTFKMVSHHGKITSLSLSDDQYYLISSGTDKLIKLWCLRQKCLLAEFRGHTKTIWSISFSKSGYFFLSGSADRTIKLWSTDDSIAQRVFIGHLEDVTKVDFMKNPDLFASASEDRTVKIWNTFNTQCINTITFDNPIINFKSSISGRYFAACDCLGKMSIYDLLKGEMMSSFKVPQKENSETGKIRYLRIHDMCFSMDEKQFTCVSSKYIVIYTMDKISQRQSKNIFVQSGKESKDRTIATKQVINTGRDSNLVYCDYHDKGVLLVATTLTKKY